MQQHFTQEHCVEADFSTFFKSASFAHIMRFLPSKISGLPSLALRSALEDKPVGGKVEESKIFNIMKDRLNQKLGPMDDLWHLVIFEVLPEKDMVTANMLATNPSGPPALLLARAFLAALLHHTGGPGPRPVGYAMRSQRKATSAVVTG